MKVREHNEQPPTFSGRAVSNIPAEELKRLLALRHHDPHSILGAHSTDRGVIVRAYRPDAQKIFAMLDGEPPREMLMRPEPGLFEILIADRRQIFPYQLRVHYPGGLVATIREPYPFPPTLGALDLHLWAEQKHERIWDKLGAHVLEFEGVQGTSFAVWAPNADGVSVVGDFNSWDGRLDMMRMLGSSGVWEIFVPDLPAGTRYKFEIRTQAAGLTIKSDPFALATENPPATASRVYHSDYSFGDDAWISERSSRDPLRAPVAIYEMHLGSWRRVPEQGNRPLTYRELAAQLVEYLLDVGFTHVEFLPVMEHPFTGSWGYETTGYYAPTARYGSPDDFRYLIDCLHRNGIGVILDWTPAHFPTDSFGLARFDGSALYEHLDPRQGFHPEWNTYIFNFGRNEVRSFLQGSAKYWIEEFHADGIRVDAVSSMLYLDYGRKSGEWVPNIHGGNENLEAISFLKERTQSRSDDDCRGVHFVAGGQPSLVCRRSWLRLQVGHGMDARHARLLQQGTDLPAISSSRSDLRICLRVVRKFHAAAFSRRGGVRQALADRQDGGRSMAEVCQLARAVRLHVGAAGEKNSFHGWRVWPMARMES